MWKAALEPEAGAGLHGPVAVDVAVDFLALDFLAMIFSFLKAGRFTAEERR